MSAPSAYTNTTSVQPQFRLRTLLLLTVWAAVICLGISAPSEAFASAIAASNALAIMFATLVALYRNGSVRATAIGFIVFCLGWVMLYEGTILSPLFGPDAGVRRTFAAFATVVHGQQISDDDPWSNSSPTNGASSTQYQRANFVYICIHALATLLGLLGSLLAQYLYATQPREKLTTTNPQP